MALKSYNRTSLVQTKAIYEDTPPDNANTGTIWVDSNASAAIINTNDFVLKSEVEAYVPHTFLLMGG